MMSRPILMAAVFGLMFAVLPPARTAVEGYAFSGALDSGAYVGLSYSVSSSDPQFSFIPGYFAYDTMAGFSGAGAIAYAPIPEPRDWMLMLAGIGQIVMMVGRNRRRAG